jgi:hypothetical protein
MLNFKQLSFLVSSILSVYQLSSVTLSISNRVSVSATIVFTFLPQQEHFLSLFACCCVVACVVAIIAIFYCSPRPPRSFLFLLIMKKQDILLGWSST